MSRETLASYDIGYAQGYDDALLDALAAVDQGGRAEQQIRALLKADS